MKKLILLLLFLTISCSNIIINKVNELSSQLVYWSSFRNDTLEINPDDAKTHLAEYRKKLMKILKKNDKNWNQTDERRLNNLYYHKINLNKFKEIGDIVNYDFKKIFYNDKENTTSGYPKYRFLWNILNCEVIIEGDVIRKRIVNPFIGEFNKDNNFNVEYLIKVKKVLYVNDNYYNNILDSVKVYAPPLTIRGDLKYNDYLNNNTGIFTFSKHQYDLIKSYSLEMYNNEAIELFHKITIFPPGEEITRDWYISGYYKFDIYDLIGKFKEINDPENFYKRKYK